MEPKFSKRAFDPK